MTAGAQHAEGTALSASHGDESVDAAVTAARRVVAALLGAGDDGDVDMAGVATELDVVADRIERHSPSRDERMTLMWSQQRGRRHDPVTGPENAVAPPLPLIGGEDGAVRGEVTLGLAYQGPPGCVHGGVTALLLDHTLGVANHWGGGPTAMTAELTVRYHRPTPLFTPLTVAARQVDMRGRKIRVTGEISADGRRCVSAEGLFIATTPPDPH